MTGTLNFLVSADFPPTYYAGWHMLNTLLQRRSGLRLHLLMPSDLKEQRQMLENENIDVVYANPFDAAHLVRVNGYRALAKPIDLCDEVIIASSATSAYQRIEDLQPGCQIAATSNGDIKLIGERMLEPADLNTQNINWVGVESYTGVARLVLKGEADAGLFLASAYHNLASLTRRQMTVLVESFLNEISHVFLVNPIHAQEIASLQKVLVGIGSQPGDQDVLDALGFSKGLAPMTEEQAEFMIDLMETLLD